MSFFYKAKKDGVLKISAMFAVVMFAVSGCSSSGSDVTRGLPSQPLAEVAQRVLTPNPLGEVIGNGNLRVALLVPKTIPGPAAGVAAQLRNGAEMAMQDFGQGRLQLVVKDTKGQAAEAQTRASEAVSEGSSLILGPLFAANVSAASAIAQPANVTMVSFSTDTTVARRGVYLFSYTPEADTSRIIRYVSSVGRKSITAFLPNNAEGSLRERVLRETAGSNRIFVNIVKYDRTAKGIEKSIAEGAAIAAGSDTVYIPEGGPIPGLIVSGLKRNAVAMDQKQIIGSGNWESVKTSDKNLQGAFYPGRDISRFKTFADRYNSKYGARPGVQAALAYDAVTLAAELARINQNNPYTAQSLEIDRGFQGTNGAFRIRSNGTTQRGLAIYQIQGGKGILVEPAVSSFSGRGS